VSVGVRQYDFERALPDVLTQAEGFFRSAPQRASRWHDLDHSPDRTVRQTTGSGRVNRIPMTTSITLNLTRAVCCSMALTVATAISAASAVVPGALLRQGEWRQDVGSYGVPQAWEKLPARSWPMDGWATFVIDGAAATLTVRPLSTTEARLRLKPMMKHGTRKRLA